MKTNYRLTQAQLKKLKHGDTVYISHISDCITDIDELFRVLKTDYVVKCELYVSDFGEPSIGSKEYGWCFFEEDWKFYAFYKSKRDAVREMTDMMQERVDQLRREMSKWKGN